LYTACSFYKQTTKYCWQQVRYLQSRTSHTWNWNIFSLLSVKKTFTQYWERSPHLLLY
jgi:hypothetical protein